MKEKTSKKSLIVWVIITVLLMGGMYYLGYQNGKSSVASGYAGAMGGGMRGGGAARGAGMTNGNVISKDANSITVTGRDGSSKIVLYSGSTQVMKSTSGSIDDVAVGSQVTVIGKTNSDGSVTAQTISIRPNMPASNTPTTPATQ